MKKKKIILGAGAKDAISALRLGWRMYIATYNYKYYIQNQQGFTSNVRERTVKKILQLGYIQPMQSDNTHFELTESGMRIAVQLASIDLPAREIKKRL